MILVKHKNIYVTIQSSQSNSNRNWIYFYWLNEKNKKAVGLVCEKKQLRQRLMYETKYSKSGNNVWETRENKRCEFMMNVSYAIEKN